MANLTSDLQDCWGVPRLTLKYIKLKRMGEADTGQLDSDLNRSLVRRWAREILQTLDVRMVEVVGTPMNRSGLLLGNHTGYLDVPVLLSQIGTSFVAKKELSYWPLFGTAARCLDTVFVKRNSKTSRSMVGEAVLQHLGKQEASVTLFPSGTTGMGRETPWRWGAFRLAKENNLWVQPFRLRYTPLREAAFIGKDQFLPHLWKLVRAEGIRVALEFHSPVKIQSVKADSRYWQQWAESSEFSLPVTVNNPALFPLGLDLSSAELSSI